MADPEAEQAFHRCGTYEWGGEPLVWSIRHKWLWLAIVARAQFALDQQDCLAAIWVAMLTEPEDVRKVETKVRKAPESVVDAVLGFCGELDPGSEQVLAAVAVANQMEEDIIASRNEVDDTELQAEGGGPGK